MLQTLKSRVAQDRKHDEGFTLIELMVVVLIIAVLLAIAIPTFLGSQNKAKDRSAQSSLRNTVTAAKTVFTDGADYSKANIATLTATEPALTFVAAGTASDDPKSVSVNPGTSVSTVFYAAAMSKSGTCYYIKDDLTAGSGTGTTYSSTSTAADCTGTKAAAATYTSSW